MPRNNQFIKDYRLPLQATLLFFLLIGALLIVRGYEQSALADTLPDKTAASQDYATLLSTDKEDGPKKNEITPEEQAKADEAKKPAADTQTPFTISPSPSPPPPPPPPPGTPPPPPAPPFTARITQMNYGGSGPVTCGGSQASCVKTHYFGAMIQAENGPGTVSYRWNSSSDGDSSGSFSVGGGATYTPLQKEIKLSCSTPGTYTMQLLLTSPNSDQSDVIPFHHDCGLPSLP